MAQRDHKIKLFLRQILMLYFLCRNSFVMILVICRKFWWFSILNLICLSKTYKASRA